MALWLNRSDVESVLSMSAAIVVVEDAFRQLVLGKVSMPQRVGFGGQGGGGAAMPAYIGGKTGGMGVKVVTLFGGNSARSLPIVNATLILLDSDTGCLLAVMDAGYMTAVRTGAVGGVAAKHLSRQDARMVTVFGAGAQAKTQLEAACIVRPIQHAKIVDPNPEAASQFAVEMRGKLGIDVTSVTDLHAAVTGADIVITATTAHEPLFDGNWLQPGVHINGIGSHARQWRELDTTTVRRCKIVTDLTAACLAEAGDLVIPIEKGELDPSVIYAELGEIVSQQKPGRENDDELTLFKSVGLALQDVAVGVLVYQNAISAGIGQHLE